MNNYHFLKLVANNGVGKIISFFLKKLTDIVIIFSLHNNQSRSQWFLSNQCWATSYGYSVYHQIEISTMSWKGLITYYFESWMVHLTSISCSSDEDVLSYLVRRAATWIYMSFVNSVSVGKWRVIYFRLLLY